MSTLNEELRLARVALHDLLAEANEWWTKGSYDTWRDLRAEARKEAAYIAELEQRLASEG